MPLEETCALSDRMEAKASPKSKPETSPEPELMEILNALGSLELRTWTRLHAVVCREKELGYVGSDNIAERMASRLAALISTAFSKTGLRDPKVETAAEPPAKPELIPVEPGDYLVQRPISFYKNKQRHDLAQDQQGRYQAQVLQWCRDAELIRFLVRERMPVCLLSEEESADWKKRQMYSGMV
jgi:hypothetical protein